MTIDLSILKEGDIVRLKSNEMCLIEHIDFDSDYSEPFLIYFNNSEWAYYTQNGTISKLHEYNDGDIIEIISKEETIGDE